MSALVRSTAALGGTPDASWSKRPGRAYRRVEPQLVAALEPELVAALTDAQSSRLGAPTTLKASTASDEETESMD